MKLLIDENLAPSLAVRLDDLFAGSIHVSAVGLFAAPDQQIWNYAKENGFTILTKDKDFASLNLIWGAPPKVILAQLGNCATERLEAVLRTNAIRPTELERDTRRSILILK